MELTHDFTVPASVDETWQALTDIAGVASCFPGASVTSVEGDTFKGTVKVKLGPIALTYAGSGEFTGKDDAAHTLTLAAKGKDKRGNGTAGADVTASMVPDGDQTRVTVMTELQITGKPAQFGRGVIQDVSDKLLGQFTDCLEQKLAGPAPVEAAAAAPEEGAAAAPAAQAPAGGEAAGEGAGTAGPRAAEAPAEEAAAAQAPVGEAAGAGGAPRVSPIGSAPSAGTRAQGGEEALDLGATVIPILIKHYGKQIAAGVGVLFVLLLLRRLLRR
ncbi:MAG TPA: SRPBCC family protein [Marmoricola sp.]|nr:SRPBCC family protein [Marmoricola sp.]